MNLLKQVLICQSKACRKKGAANTLAAFRAIPIAEVTLISSGCLGQCGNGPMVLVLPEEVWYASVLPEEVPAIAERHLRGGQPIPAMLYRKFHPGASEL